MSEEQNKAVVRRFFEEVWNQQKDNVIDEAAATRLTLADYYRATFAAKPPWQPI